MVSSIAFLIPWFGPFPSWMSFYLKSCEYNPTIDFYFISDQNTPAHAPENCFFQKMSFTAYCDLVSSKLAIDFKPSSPYKLCDLKPALGVVHVDLLKKYDFWAFGDIDVVYGDLRFFLTETLLDDIDLFSTHGTRIAGHFTVLRNNRKWREIFKKVENWAAIFADEKHVAFDEKNFSKLFMGYKNYPLKIRDFLRYCLKPLSRRTLMQEMYSTAGGRYAWLDGSRDFPTEWYWQKGTLTNNRSNKPFLYLHFLKWKEGFGKNVPVDFVDRSKRDQCWKITKNGFENYSS